MTQDEIVAFVHNELPGTLTVIASEANGAPQAAWGDTFFIYDPERAIPPDKQFPFATIVVSDYPGFDEASDLSRDGVYRVNAWVSSETADRTTDDVDDDAGFDYSVLDKVIPHPVYAKQSWVSVLNPGPSTREAVKSLLSEAHDRAKQRYEKRTRT